MLLSFQTYVERVKLESVFDQIKRTGYQCWIHIYSSLFWIISVHIDQWKLKRSQLETLSTINNVFTTSATSSSLKEESLYPNQDTDSRLPSESKYRRRQMRKTKRVTSQQTSPIHCHPTQSVFKESNKKPNKKPSFLLLKSWKQKRRTQHDSQTSLLQTDTDQKQPFFLRRLSTSNTSIHSTECSSSISTSLESPKSILKSISFKLKSQSSYEHSRKSRSTSQKEK